MKEIIKALHDRRSVRDYLDEEIPEEKLEKIIRSGLTIPTSKNSQPVELICIKDKDMLLRLSKCRPAGPQMLKNAAAAIVVLSDEEKTDVWVEDGSISLAYMHLVADSMGIGSCWVQGRNRMYDDETTTEEHLRELLGFPKNLRLIGILSLGIPKSKPEPRSEEYFNPEKVHYEKY